MFLAIHILARVVHYGAIFVGFLTGMITSSITFHYVIGEKGNNTMALISGVASGITIGAVAGGALDSVMGAGTLAGIVLGAIGGAIGAVIGIFH